jgi:DNA-binding NtrC family response regulator
MQPERQTILVVEDEPVVREFIGAILKRYQYDVVMAPNGSEALELCGRADAQIAAAIIDLVMPDMGWDKLLPLLETVQPNAKIVLTSGFSEGRARDIYREPDAYFLQKPSTVKQIIDAVEKAIEGLTSAAKVAGAP